jgi:hypothetical protein
MGQLILLVAKRNRLLTLIKAVLVFALGRSISKVRLQAAELPNDSITFMVQIKNIDFSQLYKFVGQCYLCILKEVKRILPL